MFLSCNLLIALIDVPCKSSHCIVRLKPSVRVRHPDGDDYALSRNRGRQGREEDEDETTRKNGIGAKVSRVQRSVGLCGARPALPGGVGSLVSNPRLSARLVDFWGGGSAGSADPGHILGYPRR
jgi:hypothetical protein